MAARELVLIDTCIWVQFFNRPQSRDKQAVDALLDDDRVALIGPIVAEILLGFRRDSQADWVGNRCSIPENIGNHVPSEDCAAPRAAVDAHVALILAAWPGLSKPIRRAILALIQ